MWQLRRFGNEISFASLQHKRSSEDRETCQFFSRVYQLTCLTDERSNEGVEEGQKIHPRALSLFHYPICSGGAFISDSLSCSSEVHTSAQKFVILKMRFFSSESISVCYKQRRTPEPRSFRSGCLNGMERSGVFPSHSCAQVKLYSIQSILCGQQ